ncbi:RDD family protein [Naasia lichenicola]|uniref:RDD family protein n=1 Tax=Naasia lichenicola TaxID=2565933 RepID=A0A4V3WTH2_9MICO|nr:RDD family protein [Naasia lichenicola]THG30720.1 RDD family protein [Naasia lichenicola]THG31957.1 RDD family protein [Naasia lichenicola]
MPDRLDGPSIADDEVIVGEAVALDVRPASVILRAAGALIDIVAAGLVLLAFFTGIGFVVQFNFDNALLAALAITIIVTVLIIVPTVVELVTGGLSLGKLAVGVRIVRDDGGAIGFRHAFVRALTGVLEFWFTAGGLALLVSLLNPRAKRLGDLLAGTYSQQERVPKTIEPIWGVPESLQEWSRLADVGRLPDRLSRRIAAFLGQAGRMTPYSRGRIAADLAAEASPWVSPLPAELEPELFLAAVAVLRREREATGYALERDRLARLDPVLTGNPHGFPNR